MIEHRGRRCAAFEKWTSAGMVKETTPQVWHEPLKTGKRPWFSYRGKVWLGIALVYVASIVVIGAAFVELSH